MFLQMLKKRLNRKVGEISKKGINDLQPITAIPVSYSELFPFLKAECTSTIGIMTDSGRSALKMALDRLPVNTRNIGLPAYTCPIVRDVVEFAGFNPVSIDVDSNYELEQYTLERAIKDRGLDGIITVHLFGNLTSVERIRRIAGDRIPVIEDSCQYMDLSKPSQGDFTIYSFGLGKVITCGRGGALVINNLKFMEAPKLENTRWFAAVRNIWKMKFGTIPSVYGLFTPRTELEIDRFEPFTPKAMNPVLADVLKSQTYKLPEILARRKHNARILCELLNMEFDGTMEKQYTRFIFQCEYPGEKRKELLAAGFESELPYYRRLSSFVSNTFWPESHYMVEHNLSLPIHYRMREEDLKKMASIMNRHGC